MRGVSAAMVVSIALAAPGAAYATSTTGAPGSEKPPPGNRGDLGSNMGGSFDPRPLFATKLQVQPRNVTAGEGAVVFGTGWIPPFSCKKKGRVKVSVKVPGDERRKVGELDPFGGGINIGTGSTEIPFGSQPRRKVPFKPGFSLANINGGVTIPEKTKPGEGKLRAEQELYFRIPILGSCVKLGIGTSDKTVVKVLPAKFDSTVITDVRLLNSAVQQAAPVKLLWKLSRAGRVRVTLYHHFTERSLIPVAMLFEGSRSAGVNDHAFPMSFDGKALPAGRYRLTVEHEDQADAKAPGSKGGARTLTPARPKSLDFNAGYAP
jgi:hypothetical protein